MRRRALNLAALGLLGCGAVSAVSADANERVTLQGFTEPLPPLNYADDSGKAQGFSVDLLRMIAAQAKVPLEIQVTPWVRATQLAAGTPNSILFSLTRLPEREGKFKWVGPISGRRILLYRLRDRSDLQVKDLKSLQGLKIGVVRESAAAKRLQAEGLRVGEELELALDDSSNLRKLLAGRMDLLVMLDWAAAWNLRQLKLDYGTLRPVLELDNAYEYWYGLHPDCDDALVQRLQAGLNTLRRNGQYDKLRRQYFS